MVRAYKVSGRMTLDKGNWTTTLNSASRDVQKFAGEQERRFARMQRSLGSLGGQFQGMLSSVGLGFSVVGIVKAADAYQAIQRRIQAATKATGDFGKVSAEIFGISQRTFTDLAGTEQSFRMINMFNRSIRATNGEILTVVETVNKLGAMGGVSGERLAGGLRQFTQVMSKGKLLAEEMHIIMENLPELGKEIVLGLGLSDAEMVKMMKNGELSSKMVFDAILKRASQVNESFKNFSPTLGQEFTKVSNTFQKSMGEDLAGTLKTLAGGIELIGQNMGTVKWVGGITLAIMGINTLRGAVGSLIGTFNTGAKVLKGVSGYIERISRPQPLAPLNMAEAKQYLDLEKQARSKGVYLSFSDQVRAADERKSSAMARLKELSQQAAAAQSEQTRKAGLSSTKWGMRVGRAEDEALVATRNVNAALSQAQTTGSAAAEQALTRALKEEAAAMANLERVREKAARASQLMSDKGAKVSESWSKKLSKAEQEATKAAEAATLTRAEEVRQIQSSVKNSQAAVAARDGESAAVQRRLQIVELEEAQSKRTIGTRTRATGAIDRQTAAYGRSSYTSSIFAGAQDKEDASVSRATSAIERQTTAIDRNTDAKTRNTKEPAVGVNGKSAESAAVGPAIAPMFSEIGIGMATIAITQAVFSAIDEFKNPANQGKVPGYATGAALATGVGTAAGGIGGALLGAKIGGVIGSAFPGPGTAIGAGAGALVGTFLGGQGGGAAASSLYHAEPGYYLMDHGQKSGEKYLGERTLAMLNSSKYGDLVRNPGGAGKSSQEPARGDYALVNKASMEEAIKRQTEVAYLMHKYMDTANSTEGLNVLKRIEQIMKEQKDVALRLRPAPGVNAVPSTAY